MRTASFVPRLTVGELAAVRALTEEFSCTVKTDVQVPLGDGWLHLDAAVVRGEDLVAIEIREYAGGSFPYFQIDHLVQLGATARFDRFLKFVLYVVVVSNARPELDEPIEAKLKELASSAACEVQIRWYRLNRLRAKYHL